MEILDLKSKKKMKWKFHPTTQQEMWAERKEFNDIEDQSIQFIQSGEQRMEKTEQSLRETSWITKSLSRVRFFEAPMDCSLSGSSVHGIFQARVLEWIAISFFRGSSWPRNRTQVSRFAGRCFTVWAIREA